MNLNLKELGKRLYTDFRNHDNDSTYQYFINRNFINNLTNKERETLLNGFIEERSHITGMPIHENIQDHTETFWAMYNDLV